MASQTRGQTDLQTDNYYPVRIQSRRCTTGKLLALLFSFLVAVSLCAIIGSSAPKVFSTSGTSEQMGCTTFSCSPTFHGYLNKLTKLHQVYYLEFTLEKPYELFNSTATQANIAKQIEDQKDLDIDFDLQISVSAWGEKSPNTPKSERDTLVAGKQVTRHIRCRKGQLMCDPVTLFAEQFLEYTGYYVDATFKHPYTSSGLTSKMGRIPGSSSMSTQEIHDKLAELHQQLDPQDREFLPHAIKGHFEMKYVNSKFTKFEFGVKYTALAISIIVSCVYVYGLRATVESKYWSYEQKWIVSLLCLLVFFNDPFFVVEIYSPSLFWTGLYVLYEMTFLASMLMFWLCIFGILSQQAYWEESKQDRGFFCFYLPKAVLSLLLWFFGLSVFMFVRMQTEGDPTYYMTDNFQHYTFAKVFLEVLVIVTGIKVLYMAVRAIVLAKQNFSRPKKEFVFLFGINVLTVILILVGIGHGAFTPEVVYEVEFTTFFGLVNAYVYVMAYAYYPAVDTTVDGNGSFDEHRMHELDSVEMATTMGGGNSLTVNPIHTQPAIEDDKLHGIGV